MSPWARFFSAAALAWVFIRVLAPGAASTGTQPDIERWILSSRDEFGAGHWEKALAPTRALVDHFPTQHEVLTGLNSEFLFTSPFASYERNNTV